MTVPLSALVVAAGLSLVLLVGPRWVLGRPDGDVAVSDRLPADIVIGTVLVIVTAEVLVVLGLFEWLGLIVAALGLAVVCRCRRTRRHQARPLMDVMSDQARAVLYLLEAASDSGNQRVKQAVRRWWAEAVRPGLRLVPRLRVPAGEWAWRLSIIVVLAGGLAVRGAHALRHAALVPSGNYEQLTAMGELGQGRMFPFGAEPIGVRALLAVAAELTPASYEDVVRFAGPLLATAAIAVVCLLVFRVTNRRDAALVAAALAAAAGLGGHEAAAMVGLADALGVLIALGGVAIAMQFAQSPTAARVRHLGVAALGVVLVHPPSLVVMIPAVLAAGTVAAVRQRRAVPLVRVLLAVGAGGFAGAVPVLVALVAGADAAVSGEARAPAFESNDELLVVSLAGMVLVLLLVRAALRRRRPEAVPALVLALTSLAWLAIHEVGRATSFIGDPELSVVLLPIVAGLGLSCLRRRALVPVSLLVLAALVLPRFPPGLPDWRGEVIEHDSAARAVSRRLAGVTYMSYTVVGSRPSLSRVVGRAWRADLDEFGRRLSPEQAADPGFLLPVPSDHLLLVAETSPPTPSAGLDATRRAEVVAQGLAAQRADEWMTVYATYHPGVSVLFEDTGVRVWSVEHTGDPALATRFKLVFE